MKRFYIAPSTDPVENYDNLVEYATSLQKNGADFIHVDVMDGEFVERKTLNSSHVARINEHTLIPLDVHLMTQRPNEKIEEYAKAGANIITVHYEAMFNSDIIEDCLKKIQKSKCLAGLSINPETSVEKIKQFLNIVDLVLVMSVQPGVSGQSFINASFDKIVELANIKQQQNLNFIIEVDGGINSDITKQLKELGVEMIVSGNFVYKALDQKLAISSLRS